MSTEPLIGLLRDVAGPVPSADVAWDQLVSRILRDAAGPLRARQATLWDYTARWAGAAVSVGLVAAAAAVIAIVLTPPPRAPSATLLDAVSGGEAPARTFETAVVGPRGGAWVVMAAIGGGK